MKTRKVISYVLLIVFTIMCLSSLIACSEHLEQSKTFSSYEKAYAASEIIKLQSNSFKALNSVTYPSINNEYYEISDAYKDAVNSFSNKIYSTSFSYNDLKNYSFSPYSLYSNLHILSNMTNVENITNAFNTLLGLTAQTRNTDYIKAYKTSYYVNDYGTMQMYNGSFFKYGYNINQEKLALLTSLYTECFSTDFNNDQDVAKMLKWVDSKVQESNFMDKSVLEISDDTAFFLFSTLYFNNKWRNIFNDVDTYEDTFTLLNGTTIKKKFMHHSYTGTAYDYDDYISVYDYYSNGNKIKYLVPKTYDSTNNIFALTKNKNIFLDDETKRMDGEDTELVVNLSAPRFTDESIINFSEVLKTNSLAAAFNPFSYAFNCMVDNLSPEKSLYLAFTKQKNKISFNEDGTEIKTVTVSGVNEATSIGPMEIRTIDVNLNIPFIYIIYDRNDLPIFVGNICNPTQK